MSNKKYCDNRSLEGDCLLESQFAGCDVKCLDVKVCPEPKSDVPVNNGEGFKDFGIITFGKKHKGERWDCLPKDYLRWIAYKSGMGMDTKRKAAAVLRQVELI